MALAQESETTQQTTAARSGVVLGKAEKQLTLWTKNGREVFTYTADTIMPQRQLKDGNLVWVRLTSPDSNVATQIIIVDDEISVVGRQGREHAVIGDTWQATSPSQVVVRNKEGREMFVIDPKTFRQPLPKPGQRVAVTYRIENVKPPRYIATGLVILPDAIEKSPVTITYTEVPQEVQVAQAPPPAPAMRQPEPEMVVAELPHTATQTPLLLGLGMLLMAAGLVVRVYAR
jgi:hypothetical protein